MTQTALDAAAARPAVATPLLVLLASGLGQFVLSIDMFVVTVALPRIGAAFAATPGQVGWVVSANALALGVLTLALGRLGDILGRKRVYLWGIALFVAASLACALSPSMPVLIAARAVQGVGAAAMFPATLSLLVQAFPPERRARAIGLSGGIAGLGLILGPVLGGVLAEADNWRLVFAVNVALGLLALAAGAAWLRESRDETVARRVDWAGVVLLSLALLLLLLGIKEGTIAGWTGRGALVPLLASAAVLAGFVALERRLAAPLVDLSLFATRNFAVACAVAFLFFAGNFGALPYLSLFMQNYIGMGPLIGGLAFIPSTLPVAVMLVAGGMIVQRHAARMGWIFAFAGATSIVGGLLIVLLLRVDSSYAEVLLPSFVVRGIGIGLMVTSTAIAAVSALPPQKSGLASGTLSMARQVGTAFGVSICAAVYASTVQSSLAPLAAGGASALEPVARLRPVADPALHDASRQAIVDGLIEMSWITTLIFAAAVLLTLLIRSRARAA